jgi:large subunit ribosomal protein L25
MSEITVNAKKREISTKGAVNQLRTSGYVPGIYYTKGSDPINLTVLASSLKPLVYTSETHIVNLMIDDDQNLKAILKNIQFDPVSDKIIHCDFQGISADQTIELEVPIALTGQAKGVRDGGVLQHSIHKVLVSCLPAQIPDHITLDIANLELGKAIHVKDIVLEGVKIMHPEEMIIVSVNAPRVAEATAADGEAKAEPVVIGKGKPADDED